MGKTQQSSTSGAAASSRTATTTLAPFVAKIQFKIFPRSGAPEKDSGFTIARGRRQDTSQEVVLKGNFGPIEAGEIITIKKYKEKVDPQYGKYIQVIEVDHRDPQDRPAVVGYLAARFPLSEITAGEIFDILGPDCLAQIDADPSALAAIGVTAISAEDWQRVRMAENNRRFLIDNNFSQFEARSIAKALGAVCAADVLEQNPYALTEIEGIRFSKIDALARESGVAYDHPNRLLAGTAEILRQAENDGHICLSPEELLARVPEVLGVSGQSPDQALCQQAIERMIADQQLVKESDPQGQERLYTVEQYAVETRLIKMIADKLGAKEKDLPSFLQPGYESNVTDQQFAAVKRAFSAPISLLTGSAGCGKTTALREVIEQAERHGKEVTCLAPTGKAAKRMTEATGRPASTIHRAVGQEGMKPPNLDIERYHDPQKMITSDIVVVDEASMLDMRVAERLLSHLGPNSHLVLVGDPNQLPPVGAGSVLLDLIESQRVAHTHLDKVFRQAEGSLLVINANRVKEGQEPYWTAAEAEQALGHPVNADWEFIPSDDPQQAMDIIVEKINQEAQDHGLDPDQILVTAPSHKAEVGVRALNRRLQKEFNSQGRAVRGGLEAGDPDLRIGDRVMNTVNLYGRNGRPDVMNGDSGKIVGQEKGKILIDFGDPQPVAMSENELFGITPAYASTTHKLQGSEGPVIICPTIGSGGSRMLSRNLIYTAWTRGKSKCLVIGEKAKIKAAAEIDGSARNTTLDFKIGALVDKVAAKWERLEQLQKKKASDHAQSFVARFGRR